MRVEVEFKNDFYDAYFVAVISDQPFSVTFVVVDSNCGE